MNKTVIPVILCGGSGTRLWPASRESHPKQFLNLMGEYSLLQDTVTRAFRIAGGNAANLVTVTLAALADKVLAQLAGINPAATQHVLCEPAARNTAAAVAFAASYVDRLFGSDTFMWILPADHHIADEKALADAFRLGLDAAEKGYLATFGIRPGRPEAGYGYIRLGAALGDDSVRRAEAFVEKPDAATARSYLEAGNYLWNSGMFLFSTRIILEEYAVYAPEILNDVRMAMKNGRRRWEAAAHPYEIIPSQPFDKAIMEKSSRVAVVPCDPAWSDIGSWESLWEIRKKDKNGNATEGRTACYDTRNCLIQGKSKLIACAGVENIVVIETADALLVADRSNGDAMRELVKTLKNTGCPEVAGQTAEPRAWAMTKTIPANQDFTVREITVGGGQSRTFEPHHHAIRFWTVLEGSGQIIDDDGRRAVVRHETIFVPQGVVHNIANTGADDLKIVEVSQSAPGVFRVGQTAQRQVVA
jgi:mannose-1-phosphate guanylyltransferase / mannose-6-phosphate isomerase